MRIDVQFTDWVGVAQEILAALARRSFNVTARSRSEHPIFTSQPGNSTAKGLADLSKDLMRIPDVFGVEASWWPIAPPLQSAAWERPRKRHRCARRAAALQARDLPGRDHERVACHRRG